MTSLSDVKIPEFVFIHGIRYEVIIEPKPEDSKGKRVRGIVYYDHHKIYICSLLAPKIKQAVYLHEVTHAILRQSGNPLYRDESLVDQIAYGMQQALTMNIGEQDQVERFEEPEEKPDARGSDVDVPRMQEGATG